MRRKAFTLVELLVVIGIIGLLSSVAVLSLTQARKKSIEGKRNADIRQIMAAMQLYYDHNGSYPDTISLGCGITGNWYCLGHGTAGSCWKSVYPGCTALDNALTPYMNKIPDDPLNDTSHYGDAYLYHHNSDLAGAPSGPVLHWGSDDPTNSARCFGGTYSQWNDKPNHYWCAMKLRP
jgi:prepilin-type N-terminal cleavage/methylation domain-containing protein